MLYEMPLVGGPFAGRTVMCEGPRLLVPMPHRVLPEMIHPRVENSEGNQIQAAMYERRTAIIEIGRHTRIESTAYVYEDTPKKDFERAVLGMAFASCIVNMSAAIKEQSR